MIDLSSDTCTRPTEAMRATISKAKVGDEQRLEDPSVLALIEAMCERLGKESGLFLPSGTMCNLIAVKTHTQMGQLAYVGHNCHILRCETGAASAVSGVVLDVVPSENGCFEAESLEASIQQMGHYSPEPALVCVEQTHNFAGGAIWPLKSLQGIRETAQRRGLAVHMDGARLFNAVVASGISASTFAETTDSVWVDFTKGLGAPLGAVLCGSQEFIEKARRYKHMFGGAMRQAGMMAAGCLYALEHHVARLADDHRRAQELTNFLSSQGSFEVKPVETNLIFFRHQSIAAETFAKKLEGLGVRVSWVGDWMRAVTHLHIDDQDIEKSCQGLLRVLES